MNPNDTNHNNDTINSNHDSNNNNNNSNDDVRQMIQLLHGLIQPNTETIRAAEQALKPILKQPHSMDVLWTIITSSNNSSNSNIRNTMMMMSMIDESQYIAIRHVATIVLRKRLPAHYTSTLGPNHIGRWNGRRKYYKP
jgi:hypothetical protein